MAMLLVRLSAALSLPRLGEADFSYGASSDSTYTPDDALVLLQRSAALRAAGGLHPPTPVAHSLKLGSRGGGRNFWTPFDMAQLQQRQWPEYEDGTWTYKVDRPVKIVGWTEAGMTMATSPLDRYYTNCTWGDHPDLNSRGAITNPDADISDADVVLFYLPVFHRGAVMPRHKKKGQLWIATCAEALHRPSTNMDCSYVLDKEFMAKFDAFAGYQGAFPQLDPTIKLFTTFSDIPEEEQMRSPPPPWAEKLNVNGSELMTFTSSDCETKDRHEWMQGLIDRLKEKSRESSLLSYGACFHNSEEPSKECQENRMSWFDGWCNRCGARPLKLVTENTLESWYITEKIWDAFYEGSVPVYFGPPEVKLLVPPDSIIYHGDFASPTDLADYLLAFDEKALAKKRAWKKLPVSEWGGYQHARQSSHVTVLPRICEFAATAKAKAEAEAA